MLTEEKIKNNAKKFFETGTKYGFMTDSLMNFLGPEFIGAPASTSEKLHNAFEGGLIDHSLRVTKYAVSLNELLPESMRVDKVSLVKVCCLHQIGKAKLFKYNDSTWHRERGMMYEFNDDLIALSVGERSVMYTLKNGVDLTEEEYQAILNYTKDDSDKQAKFHASTLSKLLKQAIEMAIMEEQNSFKLFKNTTV